MFKRGNFCVGHKKDHTEHGTTKKEFLKLRKKHKVYYPPAMILDVYDDDDILPEEVIYLMTQQPSEPKQLILYCGETMLKEIQKYGK